MSGQPNALCFGATFPASGAPCFAEATTDGLIVTVYKLPVPERLSVPFSKVTLAAGGFDHDQLVVTWSVGDELVTMFLKDPDAIRSVRAQAPAALSSALQRTAWDVRRRRVYRRAFIWAPLAVLVGLLVALWINSDWIAEWAVSHIPVSWEESLGDSAYRQFIMGQTVLSDGLAAEAVQAIAARLSSALENSPYVFRVAVVDSGTVNAFALPGGRLVVFTGLLNRAESAEEVAGVLGHEFAHVLHRHATARLVNTLGLVAVVTILTGNERGFAGLIKELGVQLATLKFGRDQETEADVEGLRLLYRAKVSPDGMVAFFQRLAEQDPQQIELLSSHPMSEGRADRLRLEIARLPPLMPDPVPFDWTAVHAAIK